MFLLPNRKLENKETLNEQSKKAFIPKVVFPLKYL